MRARLVAWIVVLMVVAALAAPASAAPRAQAATPRGNAYYDDNAGLSGGGGIQAKTSRDGRAFVSLLVFVDQCLADAPVLNLQRRIPIDSSGFFSASQSGTQATVTIEGGFINRDHAAGTLKLDPKGLGSNCDYRAGFRLQYDASPQSQS